MPPASTVIPRNFAREEGGIPKLPGGEDRSLQTTLRRGWYFGAEAFREKMLGKPGSLKGGQGGRHRRESGCTGGQARDHGEWMARPILTLGLSEAGLEEADRSRLTKGDWRKRVIGRAIRKQTTVSAGWIARKLKMGVPTRTASPVSTDPGSNWGKEWKKAKRLATNLARNIANLD